MNTERVPSNETAQNLNRSNAKQNQINQKLGGKILGAIKNVFGNKEKTKSKYYLLDEHATPAQHKALKEIYREWDKAGAKMPREMGESLEAFVNDPEIWFGIHRSSMVDGRKFENDLILQQIMKEGLVNMGDASSGAFYKDPPVSKTVSHCKDMLHTIIHIKGNYKGSTGAVLVAVPQKYVDEDGKPKPGCENLVYDHNSTGTSFLKPEFLMGFVQNLGEGTTLQFKTRDEILEAAAKKEREN